MSSFIIDVSAMKSSGYSIQDIAVCLNTSSDLVKNALDFNEDFYYNYFLNEVNAEFGSG